MIDRVSHSSEKERNVVWIWQEQLSALGFRQKSRRYWQCRHRYGLDGDDHISAFLWCEDKLPGSPRRSPIVCYEWCEFHVTLEVAGHNLHFYYHELHDGRWFSAGRTSHQEIERLGACPLELSALADQTAGELVTQWGAEFSPRQ